VFQHITTKDGLASDNVNGIFQDSRGFFWLATGSGLQKFDGKNFIEILSGKGAGNRHILAGSVVGLTLEDKRGNIWMLNLFSVSVYHHLTGKIDHIEINDDTVNADFAGIRCFCMDEWGNIWIATSLNIYKYDYNKNKCILWMPIGRGNKYNATFLVYDPVKKGIWLARDQDILLIDLKSKKIKQPFSENATDYGKIPAGHFISTFSVDSKQNLWFSDYNGLLYKYNTLTYKREVFNTFYDSNKNKITEKGPEALCFAEDNNGVLWMGSYDNGLLYYDEKQDLIRSFRVNKNLPASLNYDYYINYLFRDNEGNIWAGTDKGINIFNPSFQQFTTVGEDTSIVSFPKSEAIKIFETSAGNILVGTFGKGWFMYDKNFKLKNQFYAHNKASVDNKNLVWSFAEDHQGKVWVGYQHGLISIYDTISNINQYIQVPEFKGSSVMAIECDAKGNMWFGLYSGALGKWDVTRQKFFIYKNLLRPNEQNANINDMLINKQGEIWVATIGNGFYCFDPVKEMITERYTNGKPGPAIDNIVQSLTQINDSVMGIATSYKGFLWFNKKQRSFLSFTMNDGLPINSVHGLAQDHQNNLWIATTNGLLRRNSNDAKLTSFVEEDGILNNKFMSNITTLQDGRMAIPTSTGFVYFSPDKINRLSSVPPDVQITGFTVFDRSLFIDSILSDNKTIQLGHRENFITITYASISFLGRNNTQYYYQLEGVDDSWVSAGTRRFANYTNLPPGHYTFKVKCENRDGVPSKNITTLAVYIRPPWWLTWWAYTLYALLAGVIVYSLYRNRIRDLEQKQAAQINVMVATQEEERKRISRDLHDDVGTKLSALKLFLSSLHERAFNTNNEEIKILAESSEQYITEAMQDLRRLLLNLSPAVLEEFGYSTAVEVLVNKINETKQIHFNLVMFGMKSRLPKDYELALYRITQELINNVLKHAEAKYVSLQIGQRDKKIILMIEDDGKGFDVHAHKDGYGLQNLEARTQLMHGIMTIDSQPGKGTSVWIEIPDNFSIA
jgi:signal transduction histidine kinase/ligand-binding sensor domain-containing protein